MLLPLSQVVTERLRKVSCHANLTGSVRLCTQADDILIPMLTWRNERDGSLTPTDPVNQEEWDWSVKIITQFSFMRCVVLARMLSVRLWAAVSLPAPVLPALTVADGHARCHRWSPSSEQAMMKVVASRRRGTAITIFNLKQPSEFQFLSSDIQLRAHSLDNEERRGKAEQCCAVPGTPACQSWLQMAG